MNLKQYLLNTQRTFKFRIKVLFPLENEIMDLLEKALLKYRPIAVSTPTKTMFQTNPLGFTGVHSAEVYICDVELSVPTTATLLQFDLRGILGLHKDDPSLKVFSEQEEDLEKSMLLAAKEEESKGAILNNDHYEEVEESEFSDYFGDDYNTRFVKFLKKFEEDRAKETGRGAEVDAKSPITKWDKQPKREPNAGNTEQK